MVKKKRNSPEHNEQVALFKYIRFKANSDIRYKMIYAIPNGGHRNEIVAKKLKDEGVKAGVADVAVDVPCNGYHGLKIEMKAGKNRVTKEQAEFLKMAAQFGYATAVCYTAEEAIKTIEAYLDGQKDH